jgi:hypothetical protein
MLAIWFFFLSTLSTIFAPNHFVLTLPLRCLTELGSTLESCRKNNNETVFTATMHILFTAVRLAETRWFDKSERQYYQSCSKLVHWNSTASILLLRIPESYSARRLFQLCFKRCTFSTLSAPSHFPRSLPPFPLWHWSAVLDSPESHVLNSINPLDKPQAHLLSISCRSSQHGVAPLRHILDPGLCLPTYSTCAFVRLDLLFHCGRIGIKHLWKAVIGGNFEQRALQQIGLWPK